MPDSLSYLLQGTLDFWRERFLTNPETGERLLSAEAAKATQLAGVWHQAFLDEIHRSLSQAMTEGTTVKDWVKTADAILSRYTPEGVDVAVGGGERGGEFSSWYGDLVFRMETSNAYNAGRYAEMFSKDGKSAAPYWIYSAIDDDRVREEHLALDGQVFRKDDPEGNKFLPPWDYNCRCSAEDITPDEFTDGEYEVTRGDSVTATDPETGERYRIDPSDGFGTDRIAELVPQLLLTSGTGEVAHIELLQWIDNTVRENGVNIGFDRSINVSALFPKGEFDPAYENGFPDWSRSKLETEFRRLASDKHTPIERVNVDDLNPTVEYIRQTDLVFRAKEYYEKGGKIEPLNVVRMNDKLYVVDGHARVGVEAIRTGGKETNFRAIVLEVKPKFEGAVLRSEVVRRDDPTNAPEAKAAQQAYEQARTRSDALYREHVNAFLKAPRADPDHPLWREVKRLRIESEKVAQEVKRLRAAVKEAKRQVMLDTQRLIGGEGKKLRFGSLLDARHMGRERKTAIASATEALETMLNERLLPKQQVRFVNEGGDRGWFSKYRNDINMARPDAGLAAHEMGHWIEANNATVHDRAIAFLNERTRGETAEKLNKLENSRSYRADEVAKPDRFPRAYVGKIYPGGDATEIISMGFEYMVKDPARFAREDPEYFDFIVSIIRGIF